jgi:hypothetical protein
MGECGSGDAGTADGDSHGLPLFGVRLLGGARALGYAEFVRIARHAKSVVAVLLVTTACGYVSVGCDSNLATTPKTALVPAPLNAVSASDLMASITRAGLPAPNTRDTTAVKCPRLHCLSAIDSDTVSILKFAATGPAQLYVSEIANGYQIEDAVLVFSPMVTPALKQRYRQAVDAVLR